MYLGDTTIVTGDPEIPEHIPTDSIITVVRCVPRAKMSKCHFSGCPPSNVDIVRAIVGEHAKVERHWE